MRAGRQEISAQPNNLRPKWRKRAQSWHPDQNTEQYPEVHVALPQAGKLWREAMKSSGIKKRSIILAGHKTSVSLEDDFWNCLREIADGRGKPLSKVIGEIVAQGNSDNLSSALRLFVLRHYRDQPDRQSVMVAAALDLNSIEGA